MARQKILHVIGGGEVGGAEQLVLTIMRLLDSARYEASLLCLCEGPFAGLVKEAGFMATTIAMRHRLDLSCVRPVQGLLREENIALVHTHGVRANLIARLAAHREGLPVVTTAHSVLRYDYDSPYKALLANILTRLTNGRTDCFIAISGAIREDLLKMGIPPGKIRVIYNGLDTAKFKLPGQSVRELKGTLGLNPDEPVVTIIARLHPVKGHEYFLRAAAQLVQAGIKLQLLMVGEGIYRDRIEALVDELGLTERVKMTGYYNQVENIYSISDVLCVPSLMEGLGLVILEAMYFRVPVIASNTGGIPEIIEDGHNGILIEPRDFKALGKAIKQVLEDTVLREKLIDNGQATVQAFTQENMARQVEKVYAELLK